MGGEATRPASPSDDYARTRAGLALVVVAATVITIVGIWRDAATTADHAAIDEDVVNVPQADPARIFGPWLVVALVEDDFDTHDPAPRRDRRRLARGTEPNRRPLGRILSGADWCVGGAVTDEVERLHAGSFHGDVKAWRTAAAVCAVTVVEPEHKWVR